MRIARTLAAALAAGAVAAGAAPALAQVEPLVGQIALFGYDWCPEGWQKANGANLPVNAYQALYSLYGVTYGGSPNTTFNLPNLTDRAPTGASAAHPIGTAFGAASTTLTVAQMPGHTHTLRAASAGPTTNNPAGGSLATFPAGANIYAAATATPTVAMNSGAIGMSGGGAPVPTQSPALALNWCVATNGYYPQRP